jgi:lambda repressor-like predicted transcriptional regulator
VTYYDPVLAELSEWVRHLEKARTGRDRLIRQAHAEGHSLRQIAVAAGMSATGVQYVLDKERNDGR